jgi:hypothetical protein
MKIYVWTSQKNSKDLAHFLNLRKRMTAPALNVSPWLPAAGPNSYTEATMQGSQFVTLTNEPFAPLHAFQASSASPFAMSQSVCSCGVKNPDGCVLPKSMTAPYWQQLQSRDTLFSMDKPYETGR